MATQKGSVGQPRVDVMRTQLGRVRGLGAAKSGVHVWWLERITGAALVPLSLWFLFSVMTLLGANQVQVRLWAANPLNTALLFALIWATFHHTALGLQAVIEDYIHSEPTKTISLLAMKTVAVILALASFVAVLRLAFGH